MNFEKKVNTFSQNLKIKEITDILSRIDDDIIELHKCSSDDFLSLNDSFKSNYTKTKLVSGKAKQTFDIILSSENKENLDYLKRLGDYQSEHIKEFTSLLEFYKNSLDSLLSSTDLLLFPMRNMKQNLMTLNFVLTNLKLNLSYNNSVKAGLVQSLGEYTDIIKEITKEIKSVEENGLPEIRKKFQNELKSISESKHYLLDRLSRSYYKVDEAVKFVVNKDKSSEELMKVIAERTENCSKNSADIITNLQYHDIIRQKMEHIQESHKKILDKLSDIEKEGVVEGKETENALKLYVQIKEIVSIQAAQLIKANKEFQNAIRIISQSYREIANDMVQIAQLSNGFFDITKEDSDIPLDNIAKQFHSSEEFITGIKEYRKTSGDEALSIQNDCGNIVSHNEKIETLNKKLRELSYNLLNDVLDSVTDLEVVNAGKQVKQLYKDINKNSSNINKVLDRFEEVSKNLTLKFKHEPNFKIDGEDAVSNAVHNLADSYVEVNKLLIENSETSNTVANAINQSLKEVKYYDFFEKIIAKIIEELNQVDTALENKLSGIEFDADEVDLDQYKKLYTMKSERDIHEHVVSGDDTDDFDLFGDEEAEEDDDNLELF